MNDKNSFTIYNDEGKEIKCDVLFTFDSDETGKSYVVYTDNTLDENKNIKAYAAIYDPNEVDKNLVPIESEKEWKIIETILESIQEETSKDGE